MNVIGIIAEYHPFHLGHLYQINKIKEMYKDSIIIAIVSSSFTQRGDVSILNKWDKARIALDNGIDLVIELPYFYAGQSSDIFAKGAVTILNYLGIDTLVFGMESDDINNLKLMADIQLNDKNYNNIVKEYLSNGYNYPTALSKAIKDILNLDIYLPNDLLALSYIKQVKLINNNINVIGIKRTNDYHSKEITSNIVNASLIREQFKNNLDISNYIPSYDTNKLYNVSVNDFYPLLKYQILNNINNLDKFLTVDEGIDNRIKKYIKNSNNWNELVNNIKTKRYTYNKINRMLMHILFNLTKDESKNIVIDYVRVLGFNSKGRSYLNKIKKNKDINIVTNYKDGISKLFDLENRVNNIYAIIVDNKLIYEEYSHNPIIID
ncbi:MAG: nucleotidyltransferase [Bacilli bacterium]|nr:nucleotidyltransferase [Bacilli bacterium]